MNSDIVHILRNKCNNEFIRMINELIDNKGEIYGVYWIDKNREMNENNKGIPLYYILKYSDKYITHNGVFSEKNVIQSDYNYLRDFKNFKFEIYVVKTNELEIDNNMCNLETELREYNSSIKQVSDIFQEKIKHLM